MSVPQPAGHASPLEQPLVSCVLVAPTGPGDLAAAVATYASQTYVARELLVVDDYEEPIGSLLPADPRIRHVRLERPHQPFDKLAIGARLGLGGLVAIWDPDAFYPPWRLEYQVAAMLAEGKRDPRLEMHQRADLASMDLAVQTKAVSIAIATTLAEVERR